MRRGKTGLLRSEIGGGLAKALRGWNDHNCTRACSRQTATCGYSAATTHHRVGWSRQARLHHRNEVRLTSGSLAGTALTTRGLARLRGRGVGSRRRCARAGRILYSDRCDGSHRRSKRMRPEALHMTLMVIPVRTRALTNTHLLAPNADACASTRRGACPTRVNHFCVNCF